MTDTADMVQKVALAIESEFRCNKNATPETAARAAIEAMREPTVEMRRALFDAWGGEDKDHQAFCVGIAYVAHKQMIDAALAPQVVS